MCQLDICACAPYDSGREGPVIAVVVDRRMRPRPAHEERSPSRPSLAAAPAPTRPARVPAAAR